MVESRKSDFYNAKYAAGGWSYNEDRERNWLKKHLIDGIGIEPGSRLLEIGCGMGLHSALLSEFGLKVSGIDVAEVGIEAARARGSAAEFIADSVSDVPKYFDPESLDVIYSRGMSWYHYNLSGMNRFGLDTTEETAKLFGFLKPGGLFVLQIKTDFSGFRPADDVHHNLLDDYLDLFSTLGEIVHVSNCSGIKIWSQKQAEQLKGGILIATRK